VSRQEIREHERIEKKLKTWVLSWDADKKRLFDKMVKNDVKTEMDKIEKMFESIMNECYGTAIANKLNDLTVEEINQILVEANEYMEDYQKLIKEN